MGGTVDNQISAEREAVMAKLVKIISLIFSVLPLTTTFFLDDCQLSKNMTETPRLGINGIGVDDLFDAYNKLRARVDEIQDFVECHLDKIGAAVDEFVSARRPLVILVAFVELLISYVNAVQRYGYMFRGIGEAVRDTVGSVNGTK